MKNNYIFAVRTIIEDSLYTVQYNENKEDEFDYLFNNWSDVEYLFNFFNEHSSDLQRAFYNNISIEDAISQTIKDAEYLENILTETANKGKKNATENLQTLFKPLHGSENKIYPIPDFQESKVYGSIRKSWLRIYAIRLESNVYIITGGAIKLTKTMNEREHLNNELIKINKVKQFLIEEGIADNNDVIEFFEI